MIRRRPRNEILTVDSDELSHFKQGSPCSKEVFSEDVRMAVHASNELDVIAKSTSEDPIERSEALKDFSKIVGPMLASRGIATHKF